MPFSTFTGLINHATSSTGAEILDNAREFIKDKLYYTSIPYTPGQYPHIHFFSVDTQLVYINFYSDFGPSNLAHVIRFCEILQEKLHNPATSNKKICLYSSMDNDKRANAAFLICAYMVIVQRKTPEEAYQPLMGVSPTFIPYRDAGYGAATYYITVLDCVRGLYRALSLGLLDLDNFDVDEYEFYEKVENGDFNWITGKFLALASPKDEPLPFHYQQLQQQQQQQQQQSGLFNTGMSVTSFLYGSTMGSSTAASRPIIPPSQTAPNKKFFSAYSMDNLIKYMQEKNIKTIIRLNNKTYDKRKFVEAGIEHIELYFPDGTTPPDGILKRFLEICEARDGPIAVHCKAGLGRTGTLIASFLMKHFKLTACEAISFLRVVRPGSVVGPQQNYLQAMQTKLWKMHPSSRLPSAILCWKPTSYPNLTRFGPPLVTASISSGTRPFGPQTAAGPSTAVRSSVLSASGDVYMTDVDQGSRADITSTKSGIIDTSNDITMIRGGYTSVDEYEAELDREREKATFAIDELLIPVQPRKAPVGGGAAPPGARVSPNPELWRRQNTQPGSDNIGSVGPSSQQPPYASYNQTRYTPTVPNTASQQQPSRYNLRSMASTGAPNPATSINTSAIPRAMAQGVGSTGGDLTSPTTASASANTAANRIHNAMTTGEVYNQINPNTDNMNGFVLVGGRIATGANTTNQNNNTGNNNRK